MKDTCNVESLPEWKDAPRPEWKRLDGPGCWYCDDAGKLYWREGTATQADWLSDLFQPADDFEERAAILEFDAGMPKQVAEQVARLSVSK
jgi:hypothetical protein